VRRTPAPELAGNTFGIAKYTFEEDAFVDMGRFISSIAPSEDNEAERSAAKILEPRQGDIEAGSCRAIDEFYAEIDSEQSDEHSWRWPPDN